MIATSLPDHGPEQPAPGGGGLDGAGTDAEYRRDLRLGQAKVIAEDEDLAAAARQPGQRG
jgi:hypothetical protein